MPGQFLPTEFEADCGHEWTDADQTDSDSLASTPTTVVECVDPEDAKQTSVTDFKAALQEMRTEVKEARREVGRLQSALQSHVGQQGILAQVNILNQLRWEYERWAFILPTVWRFFTWICGKL